MRLRQIALVAAELRPVETAISEQLGLEVCYRDPGLAGFGLRHGLYPIGERILEVVVPMQSGTTAGRFLERRGGDGGYMVLVQVDDVEAHKARVLDAGIRIVHDGGTTQPTLPPASGSERPQPATIRGIHLHPKDVGGAIVSIDQADPADSWGWAGYDWQYHSRPEVVTDLVAVEIQAEDPVAMAKRWGLALGRPVTTDVPEGSTADAASTAGAGGTGGAGAGGTAGGGEIVLSDATIRFVAATDGRGDGLAAADLVAADRARVGETIELCGTRFNLV